MGRKTEAPSPLFESKDDEMTSGWGTTLGKDEVENWYVVFGGLEKEELDVKRVSRGDEGHKTDPSTKINFRLFSYKFFLLFQHFAWMIRPSGVAGVSPWHVVLTLTHHGNELITRGSSLPFRDGSGTKYGRKLPGRRRSEVPCCSVTGPGVGENGDSRNAARSTESGERNTEMAHQPIERTALERRNLDSRHYFMCGERRKSTSTQPVSREKKSISYI